MVLSKHTQTPLPHKFPKKKMSSFSNQREPAQDENSPPRNHARVVGSLAESEMKHESPVSYPSLPRGLVAKRNVKDKGRRKRNLFWQAPGRSRFYQETLQTASLRASKLVAGCILQPAPTCWDPLAMCMREGDEIHTELLRIQSKFN